MTMLIAGHETIVAVLTWSIFLLAQLILYLFLVMMILYVCGTMDGPCIFFYISGIM
jgi:hypothetical protein